METVLTATQANVGFERQISTLPNAWSLLWRAAVNYFLKNKSLPYSEMSFGMLSVNNVCVAQRQWQQYHRLFGTRAESDSLPISYPNIMIGRLLFALLMSKEFPFRVFGIIHLHHKITQHAPLPRNARYNMECRYEKFTTTERGVEFEVHGRVYHQQQLAWSFTATFLHRQQLPRRKRPTKRSKDLSPLPPLQAIETINLSAQHGQNYAKVSGDCNPIHLSRFTARWFGFSQPIAHGLCLAAHAATAISLRMQIKELAIDFKAPAFLPNQINIALAEQNELVDGTPFAVKASNSPRIFATGYVR